MKKINNLQFSSIFIMLILGSFFNINSFIITSPLNNSIFVIILTFILGLLIIYLFNYILSFKKDLTLNNKIKLLFNNNLSFILNYLLIFCYFIFLIYNFYNLNYFIKLTFLDNTPLYVIGLSIIICITYINTKGLEVLSRVSFILLVISIFLMIIPLISLFNLIDFSNFMPINIDIKNIYNDSLSVIITNICEIFILLIPKNKIINNKKTNKYIYISYLITFIIILISFIYIIGILGINLPKLYEYPLYNIYKRINIFSFMNRIENILIIKWIFESFIFLSLITNYISKTITKKNNSYIYISITLISLFLSLIIFKKEENLIFFKNYIIPITSIILLIIILIISIKIILYNKKNNNTKYNSN